MLAALQAAGHTAVVKPWPLKGSSWWGLAAYAAAVGPPQPILTMARDATRVEIIE